MLTDHLFPPPPQFNQAPLRCDDITLARQRALTRLSDFAGIAESLIGTLNVEHSTLNLEFPATARGFALHCFKASPFAGEVAELLSRSKINITANDHVDAPHVMLIDPRKHWGVLGPIRGDIALFADGHAAIVTKPLCLGCQHFEAVSLTTDALPAADGPQIAKLVHWTSTVRWLVRLVDEREPSEARQTAAGSPQGSEAHQHEPFSGQAAAPSSAALSASSNAAKPRKRKLTGLA